MCTKILRYSDSIMISGLAFKSLICGSKIRSTFQLLNGLHHEPQGKGGRHVNSTGKSVASSAPLSTYT